MSNPKRTPWYPPEVKPVRVGVYEVAMTIVPVWYRYWDGENWHVGDETPALALKSAPLNGTSWSVKHWRGLTEKAK